ncbi:MAG: DNA-deoxyinosine glycosylase [Clostridiales bacterium]|nr:DNA-deoxyinosine glycosylase [Clostridiales bacterium]
MDSGKVEHIFEPFYNKDSRILILGTMPSPKSRELGFYYGHPRNRFWMIMADLLEGELPETVNQKKLLLTRNHIALWDVLASCEIKGADDSSIKKPIANDMDVILGAADIKEVFTTGTKATDLYKKLCYPKCKVASTGLPSTSPANCACSYDKLMIAYSKILDFLK